jgi:hypothetical protein
MCKYIRHDILLKPRDNRGFILSRNEYFCLRMKLETKVLHFGAPKLYHSFAARVKEIYKLLHLLLFLCNLARFLRHARCESFSFAFVIACVLI